jgi:hypothetical protein
MGIMLIMAVVFLGLSNKVKQNLQSTCNSDKLRNANLGVMITSVVLLTASLSYFACTARCDCGDLNTYTLIYTTLSLTIGIIMIVLGTIIIDESKGTCESNNSGTIQKLGIVITILSAGAIGLEMYNKTKKPSSGKKNSFSM